MADMNSIFNSINFCLLEDRLETYKKWQFGNDAPCSASKMAEAGFYQPNPLGEPGLVKCFICLKELDGWEINDDPWKEHESHQSSCLFIKKKKTENELTLEELLFMLQGSILQSLDVA
ncbi:unnamed protein product [Bemisia tabaci]|uniref:Uncharacterized protein n=1 Tax=Bemisia tabaci TaxID=7038 RepID=A0A9P0CGD5_BEMTA|nr:unnamed protein product [Bemisia tabaci]